jgi:streptogrisin C
MHLDNGGGDNGALYISNNSWGRESGWTDWRTGARLAVQYYDTAPVGTPVCHAGSTTGIACGFVVQTNATVVVSYDDGFRTLAGMIDARGPCAQPGDSGGPVVNQNLRGAVGIVTAGACGSGDAGGAFGGPNRLIIEPVQRMIATYGIYPYGG